MSSGLPASTSSKSLLDTLDSPTKLQELFAGFSASSNHENDSGERSDSEGSAALALAEKRLLLSAQLGLALLEKQAVLVEENAKLQGKQKELEASISQLLDRLAQSYKDNAQLIKRAERANSNLDASEVSNRQLLITLEEDRKTIRRLKAREGRSNTPQSSAGRDNDLEDLQQELDAERKRAQAAEAKAQKALSKLADSEQHLHNVTSQLDKANDHRGRHSVSASRNRSRPNSISLSTSSNIIPCEDQEDLVQLVDHLKHENALMRVDIQELRGLLDSSRDQLVNFQTERSSDLLTRPLDDDSRSGDLSTELQSASDGALRSPGGSSGPSTSTAMTSQGGYDWMPTPMYQSSNLMGRLPHTSNESAQSNSLSSQIGHARRRHNFSRQFSGSRRPGMRAVSVDLSNLAQRKMEDLDGDPYGRLPSPALRGSSPVLRPFALAASVNSLSSSIGSPSLPTAHEDDREADFTDTHPTILEIVPSPIKEPHQGAGGLSMSSPTKRRETLSKRTRDVAVQTLPHEARKSNAYHPDNATFGACASSVLSSEAASDVDSSERYSALQRASHQDKHETRTGALGVLLEHVLRLVSRLKTADIVSLEQRLKRQNLPGDVSLLAKSTMRDILSDIDAMRNHFRQVLEQEASALASESGTAAQDLSSESLMARKDFITVVKLFRDVLHELGRLRLIINRVALDPQLAARLRDVEAIQAPTDLLTGTLPGLSDKSGATSLLAPLSRLFYGGDALAGNRAGTAHGQGGMKSRAAPKIEASSALATATINVEFGGQGGIRRQVSIMPQSGDGGLAGKYNSLGKGLPNHSKPPRRELSSIFAGGSGATRAPSGDHWVVLPRGSTARQASGAPASRQLPHQRYSRHVDAVVDNVPEEDDFRPNLLERTLRPRGLSDSSIHSTFLAHANPSGRLISPAGLALSATTDVVLPGEGTFTRGDATVRARLAPPVKSKSTSVPHAISGENNPSNPNTVEFKSKNSGSKHALQKRSTNDLQVPMISNQTTPTKPLPARSSLDPPHADLDLAGKSPSGPAGLFANIGAWAARAGGNLSGSYVDPGHMNAERRPAIRSASTSTARKLIVREADV